MIVGLGGVSQSVMVLHVLCFQTCRCRLQYTDVFGSYNTLSPETSFGWKCNMCAFKPGLNVNCF